MGLWFVLPAFLKAILLTGFGWCSYQSSERAPYALIKQIHTPAKKKNAGQRSKKFFKYLYKAASQLWGRETIFSLLYCRSSLSSWRGHSSQLLYWQRFVEKPTVAYKVFNSKNPTDFSFWAFALQLRINFGSSLQQESKSCARPAVNLLAHLCHQEHKSCYLQTTVNLPLQN